MATILEMTVGIVSAHASATEMSKEDLLNEIANIYTALALLEKGEAVSGEPEAAGAVPSKADIKKSISKNAITCLICGKGGMKTLARHLKTAHDLKPGQYKKQFGIPSKQSLAAKSYSESRREMAIARGLGDKLAAARAARKPAAPKAKNAPKAKAVAKKK